MQLYPTSVFPSYLQWVPTTERTQSDEIRWFHWAQIQSIAYIARNISQTYPASNLEFIWLIHSSGCLRCGEAWTMSAWLRFDWNTRKIASMSGVSKTNARTHVRPIPVHSWVFSKTNCRNCKPMRVWTHRKQAAESNYCLRSALCWGYQCRARRELQFAHRSTISEIWNRCSQPIRISCTRRKNPRDCFSLLKIEDRWFDLISYIIMFKLKIVLAENMKKNSIKLSILPRGWRWWEFSSCLFNTTKIKYRVLLFLFLFLVGLVFLSIEPLFEDKILECILREGNFDFISIPQRSLYYQLFLFLIHFYGLSVAMSHSEGPAASISFLRVPNYDALSISLIIFVVTLEVRPIRPVELSFSMQLIILPLSLICLTIWPYICTLSIHFPFPEITSITLIENSSKFSFNPKT